MPSQSTGRFSKSICSFCIILILGIISACSSPAQEITLTTRTPGFTGNIYIGGAVNNPGLYPFSTDDSLDDLIKAAGGLLVGADASQVVLTIAEPGSVSSPQRIDINRAESWLLAALPGIGDVHARDIVAYRQANGPFRSISDLLMVKGIGQSTLDQISPFITVSD